MYSTHPLVREEAAAKQSQVNNDILIFQCLSIPLMGRTFGELEHSQMFTFHIGEGRNECHTRLREALHKTWNRTCRVKTTNPSFSMKRQQHVSSVQEMVMGVQFLFTLNVH